MADENAEQMTRSTRDPAALQRALQSWIAGRLPAGAGPRVSEVTSPSATGMSSETLLFDVHWNEDGAAKQGAFVARVEPDLDDCPIFPVYDLKAQFELLRIVGERSRVPVPQARWLELDRARSARPSS